MKKQNFKFLSFNIIKGKDIDLLIEQKVPEDKKRGYVPAYLYSINLSGSEQTIGTIDLRIGSNTQTYYGGHIGYAIDKNFRGNQYAVKACKLLKQVALAHGMSELIITCNPENIASKKTCLRLGAKLIEIVNLPTDNDMYIEGERRKCIFKWRISS